MSLTEIAPQTLLFLATCFPESLVPTETLRQFEKAPFDRSALGSALATLPVNLLCKALSSGEMSTLDARRPTLSAASHHRISYETTGAYHLMSR
jgi:hypothetical protein